MDASGQTVEERRELRLKQRNLKTLIIEQQAVREGSSRGDFGVAVRNERRSWRLLVRRG